MKGEFISLKTAKMLSDKEVEKIQGKNEMILDMWDKEGLAQGWVEAHLRYKELQKRIDKSIEYIKSHNPSDIGICGNEKKYYYTLDEDSVDNLLEILEGKDE